MGEKENGNTLYGCTIPFIWKKKKSSFVNALRRLEKIKATEIRHWLELQAIPQV